MKKITSLLLVTSVALLAAGHQQTSDCSVTRSYIQNQVIVNNIVADTPKTNLITSGQSFAFGAQYIYANDISILNIPVGMQIGYGFGFEVNIPLVSANSVYNPMTYRFEDNMGLGDISFGPNYHLGALTAPMGLHVATLLYKTATGDVNKGLGSDVDAISLSYKFTKMIDTKYTVNTLFSYTLNDDTVSGDAYMAMIGGSMPCLFSDEISTSTKLTYFAVADNKYNFGEVNSADLWIQWDTNKLVTGVPLGFGIKVPIINEVDGLDADKTVMFYLSITSLF